MPGADFRLIGLCTRSFEGTAQFREIARCGSTSVAACLVSKTLDSEERQVQRPGSATELRSGSAATRRRRPGSTSCRRAMVPSACGRDILPCDRPHDGSIGLDESAAMLRRNSLPKSGYKRGSAKPKQRPIVDEDGDSRIERLSPLGDHGRDPPLRCAGRQSSVARTGFFLEGSQHMPCATSRSVGPSIAGRMRGETLHRGLATRQG